jgi:signal peptidase
MDIRDISIRLGVVALLIPFLLFTVPGLTGNREAFIVASGSMEPTIPEGSVIFIKYTPESRVEEGDIIAFRNWNISPDKPFFVTHRVIDVHQNDSQIYFTTQGDANPEPDAEPVPSNRLIGKVSMIIPYYGHLIEWSRTLVGFIILIMIPAGALIYLEIRNITRELNGEEKLSELVGFSQIMESESEADNETGYRWQDDIGSTLEDRDEN